MKKLLICSMLVGALAACGDDDGRDGPITLMDSGTSPGADAGTTPTMDGGSTMTEDAGSTSMCPPMTIPAPTMAACTMAQIEELQSAAMMSQAAIQTWFSENPDCGTCVNNGILACATANGCDAEWGNIDCCVREACASATTQAELDACSRSALAEGGECATENAAFDSCIGALPMGTCGIDPVCVM